MLRMLNRAWRFVATVFCFAVFGVGGLVMRVVLFPALGLFVRNRARRTALARKTISRSFAGFIGLMHVLGIYRYTITGVERLNRPGLLILANHPSLIDIVFLIGLSQRANCIVKAALRKNPFTRGPLLGANYITNDLQGIEMLDMCIECIQQGDHLIIFPEGTRTPHDATSLHFQRGSANIAVRANQPITPVVIVCNQPFLTKGAPWWKVPPVRPDFHIEIREDLDTQHLIEGSANEAIAARRLTQFLQTYFEKDVLHVPSN